MPGPISDSYDPEFGTALNAYEIVDAINEVGVRIGKRIGPELKNIFEVTRAKNGARESFDLSEREMRIIRFCLNRAIESI